MSKISVLIPTYKPGWYLQRYLQSIEEQTLPKDKFKVYIALNGPKDNFEEVIHSALDNTNFDYEFFYLELASVSNARNHLTENSTEEAVSLVTDQGYSVAEAAEAVGVNPNQIYNWKKQQEEQANGTMLNDNERTELLKLRAENKRLKMEKDILKKASAFFAREMK